MSWEYDPDQWTEKYDKGRKVVVKKKTKRPTMKDAHAEIERAELNEQFRAMLIDHNPGMEAAYFGYSLRDLDEESLRKLAKVLIADLNERF